MDMIHQPTYLVAIVFCNGECVFGRVLDLVTHALYYQQLQFVICLLINTICCTIICLVRDSVDSVCRDGVDVQHMQFKQKLYNFT